MKRNAAFNSIALILTVALVMTACSSDKAVGDGELVLTFDGKSCAYEGPTLLKAGPATLRLNNNAEGIATAALVRHAGGETIQEMIDYLGEEPSTKGFPPWAHGRTPPKEVTAGESTIWDVIMLPGIYSMACISGEAPYPAWFGAGLTVVN